MFDVQNTHTFFVDSEKEKAKFSVADRLETHPSLVGRTHNRPRLADLTSGKFSAASLDPDQAADISKTSGKLHRAYSVTPWQRPELDRPVWCAGKAYKELSQRVGREQQLAVVQRKMEMKAALREKIKPVRLVSGEEKSAAPQYLWPKERKR